MLISSFKALWPETLISPNECYCCVPKLASQNLLSAKHQICLIRGLWETEGSMIFQEEIWQITLMQGSGEELHEWHTENEQERYSRGRQEFRQLGY